MKPCGELEGGALKSCLLEDYVFFFVFVFLCFCLENGRNSALASRGQSSHTRENISASYADYYGGASVTD